MPHQPAEARVHNFNEVALGLDLDGAFHEAERCLRCKKPRCVPGCPVGIDIPGFISALARKDVEASYRILKSANALPAVCGRVCPQESQCEATCVVGLKFKPVAIGRLERFVADAAMGRGWEQPAAATVAETKRAAIIGSGPAGLACAGELARRGVAVTIFEALHVAGGVLKYGIPEFRLPDLIIDAEIENLKKMGVEIQLDTIIGKLFTIPQLLGEMGFQSAFVGTGAGSPKFASIPGEAYNGVFSANEFLTRVNLMRGHRQPLYDTPVGMGKRVAVVGAGNTAMDSARVAHAHGRGIGDRGVPPFAARIAGARGGTGARHRRGHPIPVADAPGRDSGRFRRLGHRHALPEDGTRRAGFLGPPPAGGGRRLGLPD